MQVNEIGKPFIYPSPLKFNCPLKDCGKVSSTLTSLSKLLNLEMSNNSNNNNNSNNLLSPTSVTNISLMIARKLPGFHFLPYGYCNT